VPLVLVIGLFLGGAADKSGAPSTSGSSPAVLPAVSVSAPPLSSSTSRGCTAVLQVLPERLAGLAPRVVHSTPSSSFVVAWGDPPIVLRCGVPRPASLRPGDTELLTGVNGVFFSKRTDGDASVFTVVDRAVYIEVRVPAKYGGGPLAPLAAAIGKALPPVCRPTASQGSTPVPDKDLCSHRK
jgi:hypothetical protein